MAGYHLHHRTALTGVVFKFAGEKGIRSDGSDAVELTDGEWRVLILSTDQDGPSLVVETVHEAYPDSDSHAVRVTCSDGEQYVIKGANSGRVPFNEQVVAHLGQLLEAPIPETAIAELSLELQQAAPELALVTPGLVHASRFEPDCSDRTGVEFTDEPENRGRILALAILYTWVRAWDQQLIYKKHNPRLVFSVDHGCFFMGGPDWTTSSLQSASEVYQLDTFFPTITRQPDIIEQKFSRLEQITPTQLATITGRPPAVWGVTVEERVALCRYLAKRHEQVLRLGRS